MSSTSGFGDTCEEEQNAEICQSLWQSCVVLRNGHRLDGFSTQKLNSGNYAIHCGERTSIFTCIGMREILATAAEAPSCWTTGIWVAFSRTSSDGEGRARREGRQYRYVDPATLAVDVRTRSTFYDKKSHAQKQNKEMDIHTLFCSDQSHCCDIFQFHLSHSRLHIGAFFTHERSSSRDT